MCFRLRPSDDRRRGCLISIPFTLLLLATSLDLSCIFFLKVTQGHGTAVEL
jgi:hypothetical protein